MKLIRISPLLLGLKGVPAHDENGFALKLSTSINELGKRHPPNRKLEDFGICGSQCVDYDLCECLNGNIDRCIVSSIQDYCEGGSLSSCVPQWLQSSCSTLCADSTVSDTSVYCSACDLLECCDGTNSFPTCVESFPGVTNLLNLIDSIGGVPFDENNFTLSDLDDNLFNGVDENNNYEDDFISSGVEDATTLFPIIMDLIENPNSMPVEFCPDGTCPLVGFCECLSGDLGKCSADLVSDICASGALFQCGPEGFEDKCTAACSGDGNGDILNATFCALCDIATCCNDGTSTIEDCAKAAVPFDDDFSLGGIDSFVDDDFTSGVLSGAGFGNITDLFPIITDLIENPASILPDFCPDGACPVTGFCECLSGDESQCSLELVHEVCSQSAFFTCGPEGFEDMCTTECSGGVDGDVLNAAFCALCDIATCCNDGTSTIEDCAKSAVSFDYDFSQEDIGSYFDDDFVSGIVSGAGLGNITNIFPMITDLIENPASILPEFCPDGTCPVTGFCECLSGDESQCSLELVHEVCSQSAFFTCGPEGFEDMCTTECSGGVDGDVLNAAFCALCDIATCCNDGTSTIEDCAKAAVSFDYDFSQEDIGSYFDDDFVSGIVSGAGLENITDLFPMITDLIQNPASILPEFCPDGTCPVAGFCECLSGDKSQCSLELAHEVCSQSAFFTCGPEGFEDMCTTECSGEVDGDVLNAAFCALCDIATCCNDGTSTIEDCAKAAVSFDYDFSLEDIGSYFDDDFVSGIVSGAGLENITDLFPMITDLIENPASILPEFCPDGTCPVAGFCECLSGDIGQCSLDLVHEVCSQSAFFTCGPEGFEDMCTTECSGEVDGDVLNAAFCALCDIATCCNDGTSTIEDCAKAAVSFDYDFSLEDIGSYFDDDFVSGIVSGAGLGNITDLFPMITDLIENPASILPEFCPDGTCPVAGFCECLSGDIGQCSLDLVHEVCSQSAFFTCGPEGFEDMCTTECSGEVDGDVLNAAFCALCDIATCCNDGTSTIEDCAKAAIPFDIVSDFIPQGDIGDIASVIPGLDFGNIGDYGGLIASFLPGLCPGGSCPVDGFCECYGGDFSQCTETVLIEACEANALFECNAEDFEERCSTICSGEETVDFFNTALCLACDVATCCRDGGLPEDCTAEVSSLLVGLDSSTSGVVSNGNEVGNMNTTVVDSESPSDTSTSTNSTEDVAAASTEPTTRSDSASKILSIHSLIFVGITSFCLYM